MLYFECIQMSTLRILTLCGVILLTSLHNRFHITVIKPEFSNCLSFVNRFWYSLGRSHKTGFTILVDKNTISYENMIYVKLPEISFTRTKTLTHILILYISGYTIHVQVSRLSEILYTWQDKQWSRVAEYQSYIIRC